MKSTTSHTVLAAVKSTTDRSLPQPPASVRLGFRVLGQMAPGLTSRIASWLFCHPKRAAVIPSEAAVLATGHRFWLDLDGYRLAAWSWGDGPTVVLHHGWGGRASQMSVFVPPLLEAGFSVLAYDAPAHGDSPGRITSAPQMAEILRLVERRVMGIHAVIAHSLGCAVTMLAVGDGLHLERAVLLAPPSDLRGFIEIFARCLGLDPERHPDMGERAAARFDSHWDVMHLGHWARGENPPLLIFHDRNDEVLEIAHAQAVQQGWRDAQLVVTEKLGHRGIRRDPVVAARAVAFLMQEGERERGAELLLHEGTIG